MLLAVALAIGQHCHSQGFMNLDFEDATITIASGFPSYVLESDAIPGWTATPLNSLNGNLYIGYNTISLGGAAAFLYDNNNTGQKPIQGNYSVLLQGPQLSIPSTPSTAAIGQTGTIPTTAQSLTFLANQFGLQVTFKGLPIDFLVTGSTANYNVYSADISAYAGQTGQLLFTAPLNSSVLLDNIQFSSSPVPEPSTFALTALGGLLLGFRRWKK